MFASLLADCLQMFDQFRKYIGEFMKWCIELTAQDSEGHLRAKLFLVVPKYDDRRDSHSEMSRRTQSGIHAYAVERIVESAVTVTPAKSRL
jgi:hypothetical protein